MEKLYNTLKYELPEIFVDESVQKKAIRPIQRMLDISAQFKACDEEEGKVSL